MAKLLDILNSYNNLKFETVAFTAFLRLAFLMVAWPRISISGVGILNIFRLNDCFYIYSFILS